jgi:tRNA A-37 threonylcarbamoyl transferase component Bud32
VEASRRVVRDDNSDLRVQLQAADLGRRGTPGVNSLWAETEEASRVGTTLGDSYRLTRVLGEGGMGTVYEALHTRLNKRVAVKLMSPDLASDDIALARFRREAAVASHLGHPHLVNVSDFGTADSGEPYLVMEYLEGEDLQQRLRREGSLPLAAALAITKQVASALAAAHAEGIVHRDLKPANIFLVRVPDEGDFVKVLDFGISKIKASRTRLTSSAHLLGTPDYMPPEQALGADEIDDRADQWALGCIAWQMLCGRPPFVGEDMVALLYQVVNQEPDTATFRRVGLPPAVEPVFRRALAKRMGDRFATIRDFARSLELAALGELEPPAARAATAPRGVPIVVAGAGQNGAPRSAPVAAGSGHGQTVGGAVDVARLHLRNLATGLLRRLGLRDRRRLCVACGLIVVAGGVLLAWTSGGRRPATAGVVDSPAATTVAGEPRPSPEPAAGPGIVAGKPALGEQPRGAASGHAGPPSRRAARADAAAKPSPLLRGRAKAHRPASRFVNPRLRRPIIDVL